MARSRAGHSLGIDWHLPARSDVGFASRRVVTTTQATANLIEALAAEGKTWAEISDAIHLDPEAKTVATAFVEAGHGEEIAALMLP